MHRPSLFFLLVTMLIVTCQSHAETAEVIIKGVGSIKVYVEKFVPEKHNIKSCGDYKCLIDGNPFFGSDGKIPSEKITKIVFSHQNGTTNLDVSAMYNPNISSDNIKSRISVDHYWGQFYKVTGRFSDGAGTYIAQWIVTTDGSIRTHISDIETIYELFTRISGK